MIHGLHVLYPEREWPNFQFTHLRMWDNFTYWRDVHVAPSTFDFARTDHVIEQARTAGVRNITFTLGMTPTWAASSINTLHAPWLNPGCNTPPADLGQWDEFVRQMVTRYKGRVGSWQVWNEPQLRWFWTGSWDTLAEMTRRARSITRSIDPNAKVVSAPLMPLYGDGGARYLSALRAARWPVDIWAAHVYAGDGTDIEDWRFAVRQWKRTLVRARAPMRPRWVTETNTNHMRGEIAPRLVRPWMVGVERVALDERIDRVYWYAHGSHSDTSIMGIRFVNGSAGSRVLATLQ